jgi:hypothetical protein
MIGRAFVGSSARTVRQEFASATNSLRTRVASDASRRRSARSTDELWYADCARPPKTGPYPS